MPTPTSRIDAVDLSDGHTFAGGFPHDHFIWARQNVPIYWHAPTEKTPGGEGFWVVTRHEDTMAVMCDPETFSSDLVPPRRGGGTGIHDDPQAGKTMIFMDDPRHKRFRSLVNKGFSARSILALETELRRRTVALIEAMPEGQPFDFVEAFSRDLPLQAICLLLGVPQEERNHHEDETLADEILGEGHHVRVTHRACGEQQPERYGDTGNEYQHRSE